MEKSELTKEEWQELTVKVFYILTRRCILEKRKLAYFIGKEVFVPNVCGKGFSFSVSQQLVEAFSDLIEAAIKEDEEKILYGDPNGKAPTGILNSKMYKRDK